MRRSAHWSAIPLPIGLSFFVFGAISYSVDVFRKTVAAEPNLINYSTYQAMFGHLVAGPIVRYQSVARETEIARLRHGRIRRRFAAVHARLCAEGADRRYAGPSGRCRVCAALPVSLDAIVTVAAYTLHLYFDFSGYSSMAIGLGLMVGLKFPENFDNPYLEHLADRILAALAHQPVELAARLSLHSAGRKPCQPRSILSQPDGDDGAGRSLARRELDLPDLGTLARARTDGGPGLERTRGCRAIPADPRSHPDRGFCHDRLDAVSRAGLARRAETMFRGPGV